MGKILGINLGNAFVSVCYINQDGVPESVDSIFGERKTSTAVGKDEDMFVVGSHALELGYMTPEKICKYIPQHLGEPDYAFYFGSDSEKFSADELIGVVFESILMNVLYTVDEIDGAIVSCHFGGGDEKKKAIAKVLQNLVLSASYVDPFETGFKKLKRHYLKILPFKIIDEDVAAAVYYNNDCFEKKKTVLLYDMGETKFTCSVISVEGNKYEVVKRTGNYLLGGKEYNEVLRKFLIEKFCRETGFDINEVTDDIDVSVSLNEYVEKVKKLLAFKEKTSVVLGFDDTRAKIEVTREEFEEISRHLTESTFKIIEEVIENDISEKIDEAIFIGGATKMPQIKKYAEKFFKCKVSFPKDGEFASAYGALLCCDDGLIVPCYEVDNSGVEGVTFGLERLDETKFLDNECLNIDWFHPAYGIEVKVGGKPMCLTLISENCLNPTATKSFKINGKNEAVKELVIKIYECFDCADRLLSIDACVERFEPLYIKFKENTFGDDVVRVKLTLNESETLVLKLFVERTFEYMEYEIKRKGSDMKITLG